MSDDQTKDYPQFLIIDQSIVQVQLWMSELNNDGFYQRIGNSIVLLAFDYMSMGSFQGKTTKKKKENLGNILVTIHL